MVSLKVGTDKSNLEPGRYLDSPQLESTLSQFSVT